MAGTSTIGLLRVLLTANTAEFESALKRASGQAGAWSKDLGSIGRQATQLGTALTKTLTLPILGVGAGAIKMAMDFESSFAGVRKTVDATDAEFAQMEQSFRDLAKTIPVNVNEINKLGEAAGALGIPKDQIVDFARVMAQLGVTTNLTSEQAADAIARIQNIFGAAGKDTERLASTIVALGNAGASTEKEITEMAQRIAGAGHTVGLTQAQVVSFASALASVGINAEAGGSAISRIFLKMNDAVMKGGAGLAEFARVAGMSAGDFKKAFETDAAGATIAFIEGLGKLKGSGENVNTTIEGLIGKNIILKDTLFRLSGAGGELARQVDLGNKAWQDNSALTKEAQERFKTFESQLTLFWNRLKDVGITLGTALLPLMRDLLTAVEPLIAGIAKAADWFGKLPEPVRLTAVGIAGLVAAVGPLLFIFGQVVSAVGLVAGAFGTTGLATKALGVTMGGLGATTIPGLVAALGPLAVAVAGVTAAVAIGTQAWKLWGESTERQKGEQLEQARRYAMMEQAAKIAGRSVLTYAEAVQIVTEHTRKNIDEQERMQTVYTEAAGPPARLAPVIRRVGQASEETTEALKKQADALKALKAEYSGANTFADAALHMKAIGDVTKLTAEEQQRALGVLQGALDKYNALGQRAPQALLMTVIQLDAMNTKLKDSANLVDVLGLKFETELQVPAILNTFDPMKFMEPLKKAAPSALQTGISLGQSLGQGMSSALQQMGPTILGAIQGGGNVLKSVGSLFGLEMGKSFVMDFGKHITGALGSTLGGAINALIPGLGALLGPLLGKIEGFFKDLFGIDPAVKAARTSLEAFQAQLRSSLTDAQKLEAGNEQWKMDVIAVRDAFIKVGRSEAEALKLVEALWDTDHPDRARAAMEEIIKVLAQIEGKQEDATEAAEDATGAAEEAADAFQRAADAIDAIPDTKRVRIEVEGPGEWRGPGDTTHFGDGPTGDAPDGASSPSSFALTAGLATPATLSASSVNTMVREAVPLAPRTTGVVGAPINNYHVMPFMVGETWATVQRGLEQYLASTGLSTGRAREIIDGIATESAREVFARG